MIEATSDYSDFREAWMACCEHRNLMPSKANMNLWSILRMRQSILRKSEKESTPEWCQKQPQNFWSNVREKNTLTITRRRASSSEGQDYSGGSVQSCWAFGLFAAMAWNVLFRHINATNRTKFLQCDYEYINTICEHLVHWWKYVNHHWENYSQRNQGHNLSGNHSPNIHSINKSILISLISD